MKQISSGTCLYDLLDRHSTLDPVMVSVVSSISTGGYFLYYFETPQCKLKL